MKIVLTAHQMKVSGAKEAEAVEFWQPESLKQYRDWAKAEGFTEADAYLLKALQRYIKHRAINAKAGDYRKAMAEGKDVPKARAKWLEASKLYRPNKVTERAPHGLSQKKAQKVMLELAKADPEKFAELMASVGT